MSDNIEARISRLLDQLEDRTLSESEANKIMQKIEFLRSLQS